MPPRWSAACLLAVTVALPGRAEPLLRPTESTRDEYAETFTFVADLDDGTYVQVQLAVTNLGPGSATGLCRVLVTRPGTAAWTSHARHGRSGWSHVVGEDGEVLTIGACSARSGAQTMVRADLGGRSIELTFPEPLSERAPPTIVRVRDGEYRASILQAFTPVSARLVGFGAVDPLRGGGYADHSFSTVPPDALAHRWVRFRALRPPHRMLLLGRQLADGKWDPAWIWRQGEAPRSLAGIELRHAGGEGASWSLALRDGSVTDSVSSGPRLFRHAPLEELGPIGWVVGAVMDVPVTSTFRATLSESGPVDGVLEVSVLGKE